MEIRKLQLTGGSSLSITLPKKWVNRLKLKSKDSVIIYVRRSGALLIHSVHQKRQTLKTIFKIDGLTNDMITRELIAHYISGADEIVIKSQRITSDQRDRVRKISQSLIGFEIIDETSKEIFIKNIFDVAKFPIIQNIDKMFAVVRSMFEDALCAMAQKDQSLAHDVVNRDFEIDKLQLIIMRQLHSLIQDRIHDEETGLSQAELNYYEKVATQLERIADHAVKIARVTIATDKKSTTGISKRLNKITKKVLFLLESSEEMVRKLDKTLAHKILDKSREIEKIISFDKSKNYNILSENILVVDSLDRLRGYVMNIAEITIDQSIAKEGRKKL